MRGDGAPAMVLAMQTRFLMSRCDLPGARALRSLPYHHASMMDDTPELRAGQCSFKKLPGLPRVTTNLRGKPHQVLTILLREEEVTNSVMALFKIYRVVDRLLQIMKSSALPAPFPQLSRPDVSYKGRSSE